MFAKQALRPASPRLACGTQASQHVTSDSTQQPLSSQVTQTQTQTQIAKPTQTQTALLKKKSTQRQSKISLKPVTSASVTSTARPTQPATPSLVGQSRSQLSAFLQKFRATAKSEVEQDESVCSDQSDCVIQEPQKPSDSSANQAVIQTAILTQEDTQPDEANTQQQEGACFF